MELKYVFWFPQSLMVQKILWPEIWCPQGRVYATEKLEDDENDGFLKIFELKGRSNGRKGLNLIPTRKNAAERWFKIPNSLNIFDAIVGRR